MAKGHDPEKRVKDRVHLEDIDPDNTNGTDEDAARKETVEGTARLADLQELLFANHAHALLIVLQGMDTAGKNSTIRHVMSGIDPQGVGVTSYKEPTADELSHDFLWRVHRHVPPKGMIGIFNRSQYEDVLVPGVHGTLSGERIRERLTEIRHFEGMLGNEGVIIRKFFLHISKSAQERRLEERIEERRKKWKISPSDFRERAYWTDYQEAYEDAIAATSTKHAPWYVVPANHKWYRDLIVTRILVGTLADLDMSWPAEPVPPEGPGKEA